MGADHSKGRRDQQSTNTSVATGDIKAEELDRLHARCMPKGLKSVHQPRAQLQADAPVAAPAKPAADAPAQANPDVKVPVVPMGIAAGLAAHPGALQRSSSMVRTTTVLPRTDSVYRSSGLPAQGGSLVVQLGNMQRTDSMVRTSGESALNQSMTQPGPMQRTTSMVRTVAQQEAAIAQARAAGAAAGVAAAGAGALLVQQQPSLTTTAGSFVSLPVSFPRSSSLLRTSAQQEAAIAQNAPAVFQFGAVPAPSFPRSSSLIRTCTQQEAAIANFPRSSSLIRTCEQQQTALNSSFQVAPAANFPRCSSLLRTSGQQPQATISGASVPVQYAPVPDTLARSQLQIPTASSTTVLRMPLQQERNPAWQQIAQTTTQQPIAEVAQTVQPSTAQAAPQPSTQAPSSVPVQVLPSSQGVVQASTQAPSIVPSAQSGYPSGTVQYIRHAPHAPRADQVAAMQAALASARGRARSPEALTGFERIVSQNLVAGGKSATVPAKLQQMRARDVYEQQQQQQMQVQVQQVNA